MKYSFKYRFLLVFWKIFYPKKYRITLQMKRVFESLPKETKDLLVKAALKGTSVENEIS